MAERRAVPIESKRLFRWPKAGRVGRVIPKERLYTEATATNTLRQRFVDEVQRVRWAYKLGAESIRLGAAETISEIQIFEIDLKGPTLDNSVLTAIDRAIPSPIVFELRREDGLWIEQVTAAGYNRSGASKPRVSEYYRTGWIRGDEDRVPIPAALDIEGLYVQLVRALLPYPLLPGEELSDAIERMALVRKLARDISALEKQVRLEPQFNRKVELQQDMRARQAQLDALANPEPTPQTPEDATWRS